MIDLREVHDVLSECLYEINCHDNEYKHVTSKDLLVRVRMCIIWLRNNQWHSPDANALADAANASADIGAVCFSSDTISQVLVEVGPHP